MTILRDLDHGEIVRLRGKVAALEERIAEEVAANDELSRRLDWANAIAWFSGAAAAILGTVFLVEYVL